MSDSSREKDALKARRETVIKLQSAENNLWGWAKRAGGLLHKESWRAVGVTALQLSLPTAKAFGERAQGLNPRE
jgi:hypothetical protein